MQKPNNFDNTRVSGEYTPPALGGHHMTIMKVEEAQTKTGKDMIIVAFDFAAGDLQPKYFMNEFKNDIRPDKKWPRAGRQYIVVNDNDGNCSRSFKSFINAVEKSNNGFVTEWGDNFAAQFKNKKIGGVFGQVENEYQGKVTMRHELRWFCADDAATGATVPNPKYLPNNNKTAAAPASGANDFMDLPEDVADEIPFV